LPGKTWVKSTPLISRWGNGTSPALQHLAVSSGIAGDDPAGSCSFSAASSAGIDRRLAEFRLVVMYYLFSTHHQTQAFYDNLH